MDLHLLALLLFCLCREGQTVRIYYKGQTVSGVFSEALMDGECEELGHSPEDKEVLAGTIMLRGMLYLNNLKPTSEQPNVILSPLSIHLALSQLALGAAKETKDCLMDHLHGDSLPCYHQSMHNLVDQLRNDNLEVATRIFVQSGLQIKETFASKSKQFYNSEPANLEGVNEINDWVERVTHGHMKDFLTSLPPNIILMLINAVHFKGEWKNRFDPRFTSRGVFHIDNDHFVHVEMMEDATHSLSVLIDEDLEAEVARFPFKNLTSLLVVMPLNANVSTLAAKLDIIDLYDRLPEEETMEVRIPKFKLEYTQELQDTLTNMGLGKLFSDPDLSGIADGTLLVSSVVHKSSMEINEEGAEASAATSVIVARSNPSFILNRPFFFALMDDQTRVPIFLGVITNPNPEAIISQTVRKK